LREILPRPDDTLCWFSGQHSTKHYLSKSLRVINQQGR